MLNRLEKVDETLKVTSFISQKSSKILGFPVNILIMTLQVRELSEILKYLRLMIRTL